jgi:hypothetical protein
MIEIKPGEVTPLKIWNHTVNIKLPIENEGTRGIIFGDPSFSSMFLSSRYKDHFDIYNRLTSLLNAIF